ncbi:MAG: lytic transglycosylase domain-containing protein [Proteobacteria bacterium]|nr:lytic transglycosylase domain-containing protein [Pseudomonadota bacterium]
MNNIIHSKRLQILALNLVGIALIYVVSFCYGSSSAKAGWAGKDMVSFSHEINRAAEAHDVNPALIAAVIHAESEFKVRARSHVGAQGLMQIMPSTARYLGCRNAWDPAENILAGAKYLRQLIDRFDGNLPHAIAAYNAGPGAVSKHNGIPPYKETRNYVKKVLSNYSRYQRMFASDPLMS